MRRKWTLLLALGLLLSLFLVACGGNDDAADNAGDSEGNDDATESEENSSDENVLNFTNGDQIPTMDSSMATDEYAFQFLGATMEGRSEEHTSELQSRGHLVCRLLLPKK